MLPAFSASSAKRSSLLPDGMKNLCHLENQPWTQDCRLLLSWELTCWAKKVAPNSPNKDCVRTSPSCQVWTFPQRSGARGLQRDTALSPAVTTHSSLPPAASHHTAPTSTAQQLHESCPKQSSAGWLLRNTYLTWRFGLRETIDIQRDEHCSMLYHKT